MQSSGETNQGVEALSVELSKLPDEAARSTFLRNHPHLLQAGVVTQLAESVRQQVRVDVARALALAEAALSIAGQLQDKEALARSFRAKANALWFMGQCRPAIDLFDQAVVLFEEAGKMDEVGRTLSSSIQSLSLSGEYQRAFAAAQRARTIFIGLGDTWRLARLEINVANVHHRQDEFAEALASYESAYRQLLPHKDLEGLGVALHNMAVCLIALNDFHRALETYQRAREFSVSNGMPLLVAQADYNIAYLYYLRGDYERALQMLRVTRENCRENGDGYHLGLCDMDQAEIYLELNLIQEAAEMAQKAFEQFQKLGIGHEAARSLACVAVAFSQQNNAGRALELFQQVRDMFLKENNPVWPSLIDLYRALVLFDQGELTEARGLCEAALSFFRSFSPAGKAVLCHLLLARIFLQAGELGAASKSCDQSLQLLKELEAPHLSFQAYFLMGQIHEASADSGAAYASYQSARGAIETLRSSLQGEELKIAFMKNKLGVYERLVKLCCSRGSGPAPFEEAFLYIEEAKSQSLRDLIFGRARPLPAKEPLESTWNRRIRDLREELNWYYHRIEAEQLSETPVLPKRIEELQSEARARENHLVRVLRELPSLEPNISVLRGSTAVTLEETRAAVDCDTTLLEYFRVDDRLLAAVVTRDSLEIVPLGPVERVSGRLRMLHFQLSKLRLGADYVAGFRASLLRAARAHLHELYEDVLAPVCPHLNAPHLLIVPHDVLHYVPFHALFDGSQYLIDRFAVSYAPSAGIYSACHHKPSKRSGPSLILGVHDSRTPFISQEVASVAAEVAEPQLYLDDQASAAILREKGPASRLIHIATHGYFRKDNPLFSGIRLGDTYLSLYDLYGLNLPVELLTLSGCSTGLNVIAAGDELLGLTRGLLFAGAQSLLLTLWDVEDESTAEFMKYFYAGLGNQENKALALQRAMMKLRESQPHPYYWAPFILVGKVAPT